MKVSIAILLVFAVVLVHETEANWFKKTVGKVAGWVKNNCRVGIPGGVSCGFGRKRRSVSNLGFGPWQNVGPQNAQMEPGYQGPLFGNGQQQPGMSSIDPKTGFDCKSVTFPFDKIPRQTFDEAFRNIDENEDDEMDAKEMTQFQTTMGIIETCVEKQNEK